MSVVCAVCDTENGTSTNCTFCGTPLIAGPLVGGALPAGTRLMNGGLALGRVLGVGGFGITYVGVDRQLHRLVAVKEFFPYGSMREGTWVRNGADMSFPIFTAARDRFLHEARVAARFQHPGIVHVYNFFEENDTAYMVMELLRGRTLYEMIEQNGALPEQTAIGYIEHVASALDTVHKAGFVHRDLKPDNIFVTQDGRVVLLDFGTAKELVGQKHVTAMVTPGYTPPEQYLSTHAPDPRSDVYALAATLYHLVTGAMPREAPERSSGLSLVSPASLNAQLSPNVVQTIEDAMAMDPAQRPPTIAAFIGRLHEVEAPILHGPDLAASLPTTAQSPPRSSVAPAAAPAPSASAMPVPHLHNVAMMRGHGGYVRSVEFTPDEDWLVSGSEDKTVRMWGVQSHEEHARIKEHDGWISCVRVSPDGALLATACHDKTARLFELESRKLICAMRGKEGALSLSFSPDGQRIAVSFIDGFVVLYDRNGREISRTPCAKESIWSVAFSPDGSRLAFGTWTTPYVQLWDVAHWRDAGRIEGHTSGIRHVAWSPDGKHIATASKDPVVRLWDVEKRSEANRFEGHRGGVTAVAFHPNSQYLASAGTDKSIRLWDRGASRAVEVIEAHGGEVLTVAFSKSGRHLASGSQDERVGLFAVEG